MEKHLRNFKDGLKFRNKRQLLLFKLQLLELAKQREEALRGFQTKRLR